MLMNRKKKTEILNHEETEILNHEETEILNHEETEILNHEETEILNHEETEIVNHEETEIVNHEETEIEDIKIYEKNNVETQSVNKKNEYIRDIKIYEKNNIEIQSINEKNNMALRLIGDLKIQLKILDYYKKNGFSFDTEYISKYEQVRLTCLNNEIMIIINGDKYWKHIVKNFEKLYKPVKILLLSYFDDEILLKNFNIKSVNRKIDGIYIRCINEIKLEILAKCKPLS